jgi:hypothetical protein
MHFARWGRKVLYTKTLPEDVFNKILSIQPMLKSAANTNDQSSLRYTLDKFFATPVEKKAVVRYLIWNEACDDAVKAGAINVFAHLLGMADEVLFRPLSTAATSAAAPAYNNNPERVNQTMGQILLEAACLLHHKECITKVLEWKSTRGERQIRLVKPTWGALEESVAHTDPETLRLLLNALPMGEAHLVHAHEPKDKETRSMTRLRRGSAARRASAAFNGSDYELGTARVELTNLADWIPVRYVL